MRKNEAGLTILELGDVVRKGKGKVLYTVTWVPEEHLYGTVQVEVKSQNTGVLSRTNLETAVLVQDVRDTDEWKAANQAPAEKPVKEHTAYQKAVLFALNRKIGKVQSFARGLFYTIDAPANIYAGTVTEAKKVKTRKLNRRQKASRKANR